MIARPAVALALVLIFALGACGGTPATGVPGETDDTTAATDAPDPTAATPDAATPGATFAENDIGNGRPSTVTLTISGTKTDNVGSYTTTGLTRSCGNTVLNLTGNTRAFAFDFPYEDTGWIDDVTFNAEDLLAGSSTSSFYVSVSVQPKGGNSPPAVVISPEDKPDDLGTATRTDVDGTTTITVHAVNDFGEIIDMTATCGPRPG